MTRLRRIVGITAVGVAATMSAFVATTPAPAVSPFAARAQSNTCAGRYSDRVRTPHNKAGVVFHPHGDDFEIWNNSHNHPAHPVKVLYRYCYPTSNNWRNPIWSSIDHTPFPGIRKD